MSSALIRQIESRYDELSRAEAQVAAWILANPRRCADLSIGELATQCNVSDPTVVRFCRSMGLGGYRDFRAKLASTLHHPENYLHQDVGEHDTPALALNKVIDNAIKGLIELRNHTSNMPFDEAVALMTQAKQLTFVGLGASGYVARDAKHKFFRLGKPCSTALDAQSILQYAAIAEPGDLFVAVSHTGSWPELVNSMQLATDRGAGVLALTEPYSALSNKATVTLPCYASEDANLFTPMSSRLNHLALLDALQVALALSLGDSGKNKLRLAKDALTRQRSEGTSMQSPKHSPNQLPKQSHRES